MRALPLLAPIIIMSLITGITGCAPKDDESAKLSKTVEQPLEKVLEQASSKPTSFAKHAPDSIYKPSARPAIRKDPELEQRIRKLLDTMTLEQKIGQMIQVRMGDITPAEIEQYGIGSIVSGGGQTPDDKTNATATDWANYVDKLFQASIKQGAGNASIPLIWGIDAVHGHNNVHGAVLYPHNIGLGATRNPELLKQIGQATAISMAATGIDWNFAPTVAVARDYRWGRTYESYSEDPEVVATLGAKIIEGLQGSANTSEFLDQSHVVATAKHFIGDGGTGFGDDQGYTYGRQHKLFELHIKGYLSAIETGIQTVMASYNFWNGTHSHASKALLTDLLKNDLGFDGFVISDWQAIVHIPGCTIDSCAESINAGVDMFMIPKAPDWKSFYHNSIAQVKDGSIPMARIDDAVSRILRVKMRAGLWSKPSPAKRALSAKNELIGALKHRKLARQAVRESLVLLKNNNNILPLSAKSTILVTGPGANSLSMQSGGWSVSWQGADNPNTRYPGATTIYDGLASAAKAAGGRVISEISEKQKPDTVIVVFGETPYAEMYGDIQNLDTLEFEQYNKKSLALLKHYKEQGLPVVSVFLSGRPMWLSKEFNNSDAFVAAWLPGTEGQGIADVLLSKGDGSVNYDFKGTLPFSWPKNPCDAAINKGDRNYSPLLALGFGLTYKDTAEPWPKLYESTEKWQYGCRLDNELPIAKTIHFNPENKWLFHAEKMSLSSVAVTKPVTMGAVSAQPDDSKANAVKAIWDGSEEGRLDLRNGKAQNEFLKQLANNSAVVFDINIKQQGTDKVKAVIYSGHLAGSSLDINNTLDKLPKNKWHTLSIDLRCFTSHRADMNKISIPFGIHTNGKLELSVGNVQYQPNLADNATISCPQK